MKILLLIVIAAAVITGGYFLMRSGPTSDQNTMNNESQTPVASPTPTPTPTPSAMPDVVKATIVTAKGNIELDLYPKVAPETVGNFVKLSQSKFYDGIKFHRVVANFVIQGGDPLSKTDDPRVGTGGPGYAFKDEINPKALGLPDSAIQELQDRGYVFNFNLPSIHIKVGTLAMANSGPNTNGSQFYIVTTTDQPNLDGMYTAFGQVTKGMDVVRAIKQGDVIKTITIK